MASKSQTYVFSLVGRAGSGKSATGNTILGTDKFTSQCAMQSVTKMTEWGRSTRNAGKFVVIDTPGLFDTDGQSPCEKHILNEIRRSVDVAMTFSGGIDAFIIVLNADERPTQDDIQSLKVLQGLFGEDMMKYSIVLFTRRDQLEQDDVTLDEFLKTIPTFYRDVIKDCSDRVIAFNNKNKDDEKQVADLRDMVKQIKRMNGFVPYTNILLKVKPIGNDDRKSYKQDAKYGAVASKSQTYVITLVGRTGSGKSATGNTILGIDRFTSERTMQSVTKKTEWRRSTRKTGEFVVIDTPGLFDTSDQSTEKYILNEIGKSVGIAMTRGNGIDAFIIVLNADERLTEENIKSLKFLRGLFGEDMMKYSILLFTRRDLLEDENITLDEFLKTTPKFLRNVIEGCSNRVIAFNNQNKTDEKQIADLIEKITQIKEMNGHVPYTNELISKVKPIVDDDKKSYQQDANDRDVADHQANMLMNDESITLRKVKSEIGGLVGSFLSLFMKDQN